MKFDENARIISQKEIAEGVFDMWIQTTNIGEKSIPGQFVSVYTKDPSKILPRPISICEVDGQKLRLVYRILGKGTEQFAQYQAGDTIRILGPLGNGFPLEDQKAILIGGGIGIPPMLELSKRLLGEKNIVLGFRDENTFLCEDLKVYGKVSIATEDGSLGTKGNVIDAIKELGIQGSVIYACGPTPMLKAIKEYAQENHIQAWLSLEEKMACGIGACLACVCQSKEVDEHSKVHNKRVCKEGPVFDAREVEL